MCDKVVDNFLPTLKSVPDRFVINKMIKKLYNVLFTDDNMSVLMKILAMSHSQLMKWVFFV